MLRVEIENMQTIRIAIDVVKRITPTQIIKANEISNLLDLLWDMNDKLAEKKHNIALGKNDNINNLHTTSQRNANSPQK